MSLKSPTQPSDMPTGEHFAALVFGSFTTYTEGDQRSRDCPGHGYPASTDTHHTVSYQPFKDRAELDAFVIQQEKARDPKKYVILKSHVVKIELKTEVTFK